MTPINAAKKNTTSNMVSHFNYYWLLQLFAVALACSAPTTHANDLTSLEDSINAAEAHFDDIIDGAEKNIRWHQNQLIKTEYSIVYLHGFSASRQELNPLVDELADELAANVFYARLRGHGRSADAMLDGNVAAWQQDTLDAFKIGQLIGEKVILIGTSTGATLATWLNSQSNSTQAAASILISPNFKVKSRSASMVQWRLGLWLAKQLNGDYHSFKPHNEFHAKYWTERYPLDAVVPMLDLVDLVEEIDKSSIKVPQLIVYSPNDQVVDVNKIKQVSMQFTGTKVSLVPFTSSKDPAQHVLVGDSSSPNEVADMRALIIDFLRTLER
ncbi:alpha/beta hydrolase [Arenicella xantha]|uniref:Serine aminopeptidase S33 family n=1 Tax=Arenicella xantha TaxID=644221 RepID=A0A395JMV6_9GAMM|nr:alpha/beta fold hydrolase [Arenicella xantha]RBP50958.1 serine aminopeptidase S33 family [Arenicella xantha]